VPVGLITEAVILYLIREGGALNERILFLEIQVSLKV
jgi:hypothetical protein